MDRRNFLLGTGLLGAGLSVFGQTLLPRFAYAADLAKGDPRSTKKPATAIIVLYMNGGPSHLDTFDPKRDAAVSGPAKAMATRVKGIEISENLPGLADIAGSLTIVRGMTSKEGNHDRAQYLLHTGYSPNPTVEHPAFGAWVGKKLGAERSGLPPFVSIGGPSRGGGILGVAESPFVLLKGGEPPPDVALPPFVTSARAQRRESFLAAFEDDFAKKSGDDKVRDRQAIEARAMKLMRTPDLAAFRLDDESPATRAAFGDTEFGKGALTAVRLVERGVRAVEVVLDGWDTHKDNFGRIKKLSATLDPAMSALVKELQTRGLLETTIVLWLGDFGRTPKINGTDGRDHHPQAWSAVLAGGGLGKGIALGETDARGEKVVRDPVTVPNLMATLATRLGMDPAESVTAPSGRPIAMTDKGVPVASLLAP